MDSFPETYNDPPEYSHALLSHKLRERYVVPFPDCFRGGEGRGRLYTGYMNPEITLDRESKAQNTTTACLPQTRAFATLETRRKLEPKCVPQLFLGSLLKTR